MGNHRTAESELLDRMTVRPAILAGKPIVRRLRIAIEHVLAMFAAGDTAETTLREYQDLISDDVQVRLCFAYRSIACERAHDWVEL